MAAITAVVERRVVVAVGAVETVESIVLVNLTGKLREETLLKNIDLLWKIAVCGAVFILKIAHNA